MRTVNRLLILGFAMALQPHSFCNAQQVEGAPAARARVPVLVAIAPELAGGQTRFRLARFAGSAPRDVILLAPEADAAALTQAVEALLVVRRGSGDAPGMSATFRVSQPPNTRVLPWANRVLHDARNAAPRAIPGVGRRRAVQIWLPAHRGGGAIGSGN